MGEYSKKLHYTKNGNTVNITLYDGIDEQTAPALHFKHGQVDSEITLYDNETEVTDGTNPSLYVPLDTQSAFAALGTPTHPFATDLRVRYGDKVYAVLSCAKKALADCTPSEIQKIVKSGLASTMWNVGDSIPIAINGTCGSRTINGTYKATILGFNHNKALETGGSDSVHFIVGKNAEGLDICFVDSGYGGGQTSGNFFNHNKTTNSNSGGWKNSNMRSVCTQFYNALPDEWKNIIANVTKYSDNTGGGSDTASYVTATTDKVWLLSEYEVQGSRTYANSEEQNKQAQYDYYKTAGKIRLKDNDTGAAARWWLRSVYNSISNAFCNVYTDGSATNSNAYHSYGFAPGFAIA